MAGTNPQVEHLMRRAGFGMSPDERARFADLSASVLIDYLVDYERQADDVDASIGANTHVGVTATGGFSPDTNIEHARQRWLFRMVHTRRPLQEKMALFWHHHFATAYSKVASVAGPVQGTKMMAGRKDALPGQQGQIELFRQRALGSFRDLLVEIARDPAMLIWLDGRTNTRQRPQENFGREILELFTLGVGNYVEQDVYAASRVFTGWGLRLSGTSNADPNAHYEVVYTANNHDAAAKTFSFPISGNDRTIPARAAGDGLQDVVDLCTALARHPATARRLAAKLWSFFISDVEPPDESFLRSIASVYLQNGTEMKPVVRAVLRSPAFTGGQRHFARFSWPAEFVVRAIKEVGYNGFSVDSARTPLTNMGQTLFEPPDVNGWDVGRGWFSTGAMLARMNFASTIAGNQKFNLARDVASFRASPDAVLDYFLERFSTAPYDNDAHGDLAAYLRSGSGWTGADAQLNARAAGLARLIVGSSEYQLV